nr:hypothetical radical SAM family enzyme [uncultured bacterium]
MELADNGMSLLTNITLKKVNENDSYFEVEQLSNTQQYNEYIFTALRTIWGVELDYISNLFGHEALNYFKKQIINWENNGKIKQEKNTYTLTKKGKLYADAIASDLFIV